MFEQSGLFRSPTEGDAGYTKPVGTNETWWLAVDNELASIRVSQYGAVEDAECHHLNDWLTDLTTAAISR